MAEIYCLCEPSTGEVRYIGKANDSVARLKSHIRDMRRRDYPVYRWMRKLADKGLAPEMKVLEVTEDWKEAERRLIALSRARGDRLLNVAEGGDEPHCSAEVRRSNAKKLNQYLKDNPWVLEIRDAKRDLALALKKDYLPNELRAKMRAKAVEFPWLFGDWANIPDKVES